MSVLTIHAEEYLADAVRAHADRMGTSVNVAAKELLASALGLLKPPRKRHDFSEFCGILKKGEADEIRENLKVFDEIDEDMWK